VSVNKEETIKFWKSFASGSVKFLNDSSALQDRTFFHNLAHISGKRYWIFMKILRQMYPWTRKTPLNLGEVNRIRSPDPHSASVPHSPWRKFALSECSCITNVTTTVCESRRERPHMNTVTSFGQLR